MEKVKYLVPNISCMHCAHTIKSELGDQEGVESVAVDVANREVIVEFNMPATSQSLQAALAEINYPVEKIL
jgi:copper chaperone CopZ